MNPELLALCSPNQAFYPVLSIDQLSIDLEKGIDDILPTDPEPSPEAFVDCQIIQERVEAFLTIISKQDRNIFEDLVFEQRPQIDIAKDFSLTASAVSKRVARIRAQLRDFDPIFAH